MPMKISIPMEQMDIESQINDSFGRAPFYLIYSTVNKDVEYLDHRAVASQGGAGVRAAQVLADNGVRAIITHQCGENAEKILANAEVLIYEAIKGTARENLDAYENDQLKLLSSFRSILPGEKE